MIAIIIAALMALGLIDSAEQYNTLSTQEQLELQEHIIIGDVNDI